MATKKRYRPDKDGTHRAMFDKNKKKIYATQSICGICGKPVDFGIKYPNPMSPCIDHIIPVDKGGHPSDIDNLQLAHLRCNRLKSDTLLGLGREGKGVGNISNEPKKLKNINLSTNWFKYRG